MGRIRAVIFDLDDTLIYSKIDYGGVKRALIRFFVEHGVEPSLLSEDMLNFEIFKVAAESLRKSKLPKEAIERVLEEARAVLDDFEMKALGGARLMEGALETLNSLKEMGLKIGIVTNSCRVYTAKIIEVFSLNRYVDVFITRDDVNSLKPDPGHLLKALEILGVSADEVVFVGDHWIDSVCAERANVKFILFRGGRWNFRGEEVTRDAVVEDLRALPTLIQSI
ncbi:MAG: HAD family hydrolase [Candidatus Bathyarchaeota archaeon]|nr:HAD family hydrolase [Candidatus Bathyarchaeota archaeon]